MQIVYGITLFAVITQSPPSARGCLFIKEFYFPGNDLTYIEQLRLELANTVNDLFFLVFTVARYSSFARPALCALTCRLGRNKVLFEFKFEHIILI